MAASISWLTQAHAQSEPLIDWAELNAETLRHFQALIRFDTSDPPGNERPAAEYLQQVLESEGIPVEVFALEENRPNIVARLEGSGRKEPLLIMGHTDVVNVDESKWEHPPFGAVIDGEHIYGRGTVDDKDNVVAALMTMLLLKRNAVPLDRDVIFLAEAGEEGATDIGIEFMVNEHFETIAAEYCIAEAGVVTRQGGAVRYASVETTEKIPNGIDLIARGPAGHGSVPLADNAVAHLARAIVAVTQWQPPVVLNDTTRAYFTRLAEISAPEQARYYRDVLSLDPEVVEAADAWLRANEPRHASMLRTSVSPNMIDGGYRPNVIPSEARATLDVRMRPDEDPDAFLAELNRVIDDPAVEAVFNGWPGSVTGEPRDGGESSIDNDVFSIVESAVRRHYGTATIPMMQTGATDMAFLRATGMDCYGVGPAIDIEDGPLGYGAHSDQERIIEDELYRFVQFHWDIVFNLARASR
ncbi:MAG: M20/M25/M40 family metallo-hydrolase [Gammaproteobacteria bacterium]|jgi:acetylornithine deacetylase/succinyl-diaminopimelate desuccinylase-like protein